MTTTAVRPAADTALDFDTRLELVGVAMAVRIDQAALAFDVNTAHLPGADPIPHIAEIVPPRLAPTAAPNPYSTPIADLLHRARTRIESDGWCRDNLYDDQGAVCPIRAIRLEARGNQRLADDACILLLDRIQADFADAETIPSWNAAQASAAPVLLAFDRAAQHAHQRNL